MMYKKKHIEYLMSIADEIETLTAKCRPDMHEPDEQDIYGRVVGEFGFDNAVGMGVDGVGTDREQRTNLTLILENFDKKVLGVYNLADLFALIRYLKLRADGYSDYQLENMLVHHNPTPPASPAG